jgi:cytochrome P450
MATARVDGSATEAVVPAPYEAPEADARVDDLDRAMSTPEFLVDPYPVYARLRTTDPVHRGRIGAWFVSRYEDASRVLREHDSFSSDSRRLEEWQRTIEQRHGEKSPLDRTLGRTMLTADPPEHTRLRTLANRAFTPRRIALRPRVEAIVAELLDEASQAGRMDLIRDFAYPLPITVISELLGVPTSDQPLLREWTRVLIDESGSLRSSDHFDPAQIERMDSAGGSLNDYMEQLVRKRRDHPGDDLITDLLRMGANGEGMDEDEMVGTCLLILIAGHETTINLIANGTLALLSNPEEWARLRDAPALAGDAVEELLRYDSPVQMVGRAAVRDVDLGGTPVREGDPVFAVTGAANRDPERFADPERLDITRGDREHLSFGAGPHFCLGAPLARLEARIAFEALATRFPGLNLATDAPRWRPSFGLRGLEELPLTW